MSSAVLSRAATLQMALNTRGLRYAVYCGRHGGGAGEV